MSTTLSTSELSTRISSLWKGYRIRKIFADLEAVNSWDEYQSLDDDYSKKIKKNLSLFYLPALNAALDNTYQRLWNEYENNFCNCFWCIDAREEYDYSDTGLDWNESGYFD